MEQEDLLRTRPVLVVSGPTASGKSDLAIALAQAFEGEIVNVDSVQVYRGADIGSAKVSCAGQEKVPHHLLDVYSPDEQVDVSRYVQTAYKIIADIHQRGKYAVLCGGTGLYTTALFHGLATLPASDQALRRELEARTSEDLWQELLVCDESTAQRLHPHDRQRVVRAIESYRLTGRRQSELHEEHSHDDNHLYGLFLVLWWERDKLYERIDGRTENMLRAGLLEESKALSSKYGKDAPLFRSIGYAQAQQYLSGSLSEDAVEEEIAKYTRRFAKRQMTFWRNEPQKRNWKALPAPDDKEARLLRDVVRSRRTTAERETAVFPWGQDELFEKVEQRLHSPFLQNELWRLWGEVLTA